MEIAEGLVGSVSDNLPDVTPGEARTIARFLRKDAARSYTDTRLIATMNTAAQMLESLSARVTQAETTGWVVIDCSDVASPFLEDGLFASREQAETAMAEYAEQAEAIGLDIRYQVQRVVAGPAPVSPATDQEGTEK